MQDEHPARPEQPGGGFAEGLDQRPDPPAEDQESDFARGQRSGGDPEDEEHRGRFSEGVDERPDPPEEGHEGSFGEGLGRPDDA